MIDVLETSAAGPTANAETPLRSPRQFAEALGENDGELKREKPVLRAALRGTRLALFAALLQIAVLTAFFLLQHGTKAGRRSGSLRSGSRELEWRTTPRGHHTFL